MTAEDGYHLMPARFAAVCDGLATATTLTRTPSHGRIAWLHQRVHVNSVEDDRGDPAAHAGQPRMQSCLFPRRSNNTWRMTALGQILPPRNVRGMSVIPPKAAVNTDIFVRPVRASTGHCRHSRNGTLWNVGATMTAYSALMLAARTTLAHFSIWSAMNFPNSADVNDIG